MISIIIPNYNGAKYLGPCLDSIYAQSYDKFEVIVVDNGSIDDSADFIREYYPDVFVIQNDRNLGFSEAVNRGIKKATGELIFLLNNDTILRQDCLFHLFSFSLQYPNHAMFATKMVYPDGRINSAGICLSITGAAWDRGGGESDQGQYDGCCEIFGPCGGAALYRKEIFNEIGDFDRDFFMYMEDVDFAFRAKIAGYSCLYVPSAKVIHYHGGTAGIGTPFAVYYGNRNLIWCSLKNLPFILLLFLFPFIIVRNIMIICYYFSKGMGRTALRARIDAIKGAVKIIDKRNQVKRRVRCKKILGSLYPFVRTSFTAKI